MHETSIGYKIKTKLRPWHRNELFLKVDAFYLNFWHTLRKGNPKPWGWRHLFSFVSIISTPLFQCSVFNAFFLNLWHGKQTHSGPCTASGPAGQSVNTFAGKFRIDWSFLVWQSEPKWTKFVLIGTEVGILSSELGMKALEVKSCCFMQFSSNEVAHIYKLIVWFLLQWGQWRSFTNVYTCYSAHVSAILFFAFLVLLWTRMFGENVW